MRLTPQNASPDAKGQTASLERWVEFVKGGKVAGREVVTIIPQAEIGKVQKDTPPQANSSKVETLKGGDYVRAVDQQGRQPLSRALPCLAGQAGVRDLAISAQHPPRAPSSARSLSAPL